MNRSIRFSLGSGKLSQDGTRGRNPLGLVAQSQYQLVGVPLWRCFHSCIYNDRSDPVYCILPTIDITHLPLTIPQTHFLNPFFSSVLNHSIMSPTEPRVKPHEPHAPFMHSISDQLTPKDVIPGQLYADLHRWWFPETAEEVEQVRNRYIPVMIQIVCLYYTSNLS